MVFENAYSQASQTINSTATLLTGRFYPFWREVPPAERRPFHNRTLTGENLALAELLSEAGYETLAILTNPHHHGLSGFQQGFEQVRYLAPPKETVHRFYERGEEVNRQFREWFEGRDTARPFFAYLHYMDVHNPYEPPEEFRRMFTTEQRENKWQRGVPDASEMPTEEDLRYMKALYDGEIRYVDALLQELWQLIDSSGQGGNTVLIVCSDHGDEFMEHGGMGHGRTHEKEMLHMPLMFVGAPGGVPGRVADLVRNLDVGPTILDMAGLPVPDWWDGESLCPFLRGEPGTDQRLKISLANTRKVRSITTQRWHFIWDMENDEMKLYDNQADPLGTANLAESKPDVARWMLTAMFTGVERLCGSPTARLPGTATTDTQPSDGGTKVDWEQLEEQMRGLGYAD